MRVEPGETADGFGIAVPFSQPITQMENQLTARLEAYFDVTLRMKWVNSATMQGRMTCNADGNQILFRIVPRVAAKFLVVDFKVGHRTAQLTSPAVATEHLLPQTFVHLRIKLQASGFWTDSVHNVFSRTFSRNAHLCSPGRKWKNLVIE